MSRGPAGPVTLARRKVAAWTDRAREIDEARAHATRKQTEAMYDAITLGVPASIIAADTGMSRQYVHRAVTNHAARNGLPHPFRTTTPTKEHQPA